MRQPAAPLARLLARVSSNELDGELLERAARGEEGALVCRAERDVGLGRADEGREEGFEPAVHVWSVIILVVLLQGRASGCAVGTTDLVQSPSMVAMSWPAR